MGFQRTSSQKYVDWLVEHGGFFAMVYEEFMEPVAVKYLRRRQRPPFVVVPER